jgi:hypothetical protein
MHNETEGKLFNFSETGPSARPFSKRLKTKWETFCGIGAWAEKTLFYILLHVSRRAFMKRNQSVHPARPVLKKQEFKKEKRNGKLITG